MKKERTYFKLAFNEKYHAVQKETLEVVITVIRLLK